MERQTARLKRLQIERKTQGAMTTISSLHEGKITRREDWGTMGKKWRKIAHCSPLPARPNAKR
jgi:hypothetical protein